MGDFGDKIGKDAQGLVAGAVKRGEEMQPQPPRTWADKRAGYRAMTISPRPLGGDDETVSPAPSVSSKGSETGDSQRSDESKSSFSSLMGVINKLMGRGNDGAPLSEVPSAFDSKNSEKDKNKESSKGTQWSFTSLCNSAIKFFNRISEYAKTTEVENRPPQESQQRVNKPVKAKEQNNGNNKKVGMGGFLRGLMPSGVFVEAKNVNTGQAVRLELPFALPNTGFNRHQVTLPTFAEMVKGIKAKAASIKGSAGSFAEASAGALSLATDGFNTKNARKNLGGVASVASFFTSGSPSGSPSVFSAQNLRSGLSFGGSQSMSETARDFVDALSYENKSSASYGSRYSSNPFSVSGGLLGGR